MRHDKLAETLQQVSLTTLPGQALSAAEIARRCSDHGHKVTPQRIGQIERAALAKLSRRLFAPHERALLGLPALEAVKGK